MVDITSEEEALIESTFTVIKLFFCVPLPFPTPFPHIPLCLMTIKDKIPAYISRIPHTSNACSLKLGAC